MTFGGFVRAKREERGWDVRTLANKSGVNNGSISRIENAETHALMETAIRLSKSLHVTCHELLQLKPDVTDSHSPASSRAPHQLSTQDISTIIHLFEEHPLRLLDQVIKVSGAFGSDEINDLPLFLNYKEIRSGYMKEENIDQLLMELKNFPYPIKLSVDQIFAIQKSKGIISLLDLAHFLTTTRKLRGFTLLELEKATGISDSTLSNWENAKYKWVKIDDVINLDRVLHTKGELMTLAWSTCEFHPLVDKKGNHLAWNENRRILCGFIVKTSRWFQIEDEPNYLHWLNGIHAVN